MPNGRKKLEETEESLIEMALLNPVLVTVEPSDAEGDNLADSSSGGGNVTAWLIPVLVTAMPIR